MSYSGDLHHNTVELNHTLVIQITNYPDWLGASSKFVKNSTKLTCLEITGYQIKYSIVLRLLELQIRHGQKTWTQVRTVNSNSRTSKCQFSLFSKKNPIIQIFCIFGWLAVAINPDKWSSTVLHIQIIRNWNLTTIIYLGLLHTGRDGNVLHMKRVITAWNYKPIL
jgi:hypothetical protein